MATSYPNALRLIIAKQQMDADQAGYVSTILKGASLSQQIPIVEPNEYLTHKYYEKKQKTTSMLQPRMLNQNPDPTQANQYEQKIESTFQIGDAVQVDYKILKKEPGLLNRMVADKLEDLGMNLDYRIINGDPQGNNNIDVRGLKDRCETLGTNLFNSTDLTIDASAATYRSFTKLLRQARRQVRVPAGNTLVGFTTENIIDAMINGRLVAGGSAVIGDKYDDLLNNTDYVTIENIPFLYTRGDDAGNEVISTVEGVSNDTSSIYLLSLGLGVDEDSTVPNGVVGLSDNVVQMTPEFEGNMRKITMDYQYGISAPLRSVARIRQLKGAA